MLDSSNPSRYLMKIRQFVHLNTCSYIEQSFFNTVHQDIDLNGCLWCWNTICVYFLWIFLPWIYVHSHRRSYVYNLHVVIHGVGYWSVGIHGHSVCIWSGCRTIYGEKVFYFVRCLAPVVLERYSTTPCHEIFQNLLPYFYYLSTLIFI